jgi:hypothetical protein
MRWGLTEDSTQELVDVHKSTRYKAGDIVQRGLSWLRQRQDPKGSFTPDRAFMYNEAIATTALSEAHWLASSERWKEGAQRGIEFIENAQRPSPSGMGMWGWRYEPAKEFNPSGSEEEKQKLYQVDTSVSGWCVVALKSAQFSGLRVKQESMDGAMEFCKFVTAPDGGVGYMDMQSAGATLSGPFGEQFEYHPTTMSALGMCIRIFVTHNLDDQVLDLAAKKLVVDLPTYARTRRPSTITIGTTGPSR